MADVIDIVYKYKTPLESRLLAKQLYGAVNEGLISIPEVSGNENSVTLNKLNFYYQGRQVEEAPTSDFDFEKRMFHISYEGEFGIVFPCYNADAVAIGFRFPYTSDDIPHVVIGDTLFDVIYTSDFNQFGKFEDGYQGLILCHLYRVPFGEYWTWRCCFDHVAWTDRLHHEKNTNQGLRLTLGNLCKDMEAGKPFRFFIKNYNNVIKSTNVMQYNEESDSFWKRKLHFESGVALPSYEEDKYYAIGYWVSNWGSDFTLQVLSPQGRDSVSEALSDGVPDYDEKIDDPTSNHEVDDQDPDSLDEDTHYHNQAANVVGVVKWNGLLSEVMQFPNWDTLNAFNLLSRRFFDVADNGSIILRDQSITGNKLASDIRLRGVPRVPNKTRDVGNDGTLIATEAQVRGSNSDIRGLIGQPNGIASLDAEGRLPFWQAPNRQTRFTEDGVFTVPDNVTEIFISAIGAGGNGGNGGDTSGQSTGTGGGTGGFGQFILKQPYSVVPGQKYIITLGQSDGNRATIITLEGEDEEDSLVTLVGGANGGNGLRQTGSLPLVAGGVAGASGPGSPAGSNGGMASSYSNPGWTDYDYVSGYYDPSCGYREGYSETVWHPGSEGAILTGLPGGAVNIPPFFWNVFCFESIDSFPGGASLTANGTGNDAPHLPPNVYGVPGPGGGGALAFPTGGVFAGGQGAPGANGLVLFEW